MFIKDFPCLLSLTHSSHRQLDFIFNKSTQAGGKDGRSLVGERRKLSVRLIFFAWFYSTFIFISFSPRSSFQSLRLRQRQQAGWENIVKFRTRRNCTFRHNKLAHMHTHSVKLVGAKENSANLFDSYAWDWNEIEFSWEIFPFFHIFIFSSLFLLRRCSSIRSRSSRQIELKKNRRNWARRKRMVK